MITTLQTKKTKINVRLVNPNERFGYNNLLIYTGKSRLIEFYDASVVSANYALGRFITRITEGRLNKLEPPLRLEPNETWKLTQKQKDKLISWLVSMKGTEC